MITTLLEDPDSPERGLDRLMELCLKEGHYDVMERTLDRISPTYSKYQYYKQKLDKAYNNENKNKR